MSFQRPEAASMQAIMDRIAANVQVARDPERMARIAEAEQRATMQEAQAAIMRAQAMSIVGERFTEQTFANFRRTDENANALDVAQAVAKHGGGVAIHGKPGVGKSHLGAAIAHESMARGIAAVVDTVPGILRRIRATWDGDSAITESYVFNQVARVPVLVLDDLGKERLTDWSAPMLWELMDVRWSNKLPVVMTTNFAGMAAAQAHYARPVKGVEDSVLPAMWDRLKDMVDGIWVSVHGESWRGQ